MAARNNQSTLPLPRVMIKNGSVYIATHIDDPGADYEFDLQRCTTPLDLLAWVHHLSEKTWVDALLIRELIDLVSFHYGWGLYP